jgi:hypothetical protein
MSEGDKLPSRLQQNDGKVSCNSHPLQTQTKRLHHVNRRSKKVMELLSIKILIAE